MQPHEQLKLNEQLFSAISCLNKKEVDELLLKGAQINGKTTWMGYWWDLVFPQGIEAVKMALNIGVDLSLLDEDLEETAVSAATQDPDILNFLLQSTGSIKSISIEPTLLHKEALHGDMDIIKVLLKYATIEDLKTKDIYGDTPLDIALEAGHSECVALLKTAEQRLTEKERKRGQSKVTPLV